MTRQVAPFGPGRWLACLVVLTTLSPPRGAGGDAGPPEQWILERSWGEHGSGPGQFDGTTDVLVANGRVYVSDVGNDRIQVFDPSGGFLFSWGRAGSGNGEFLGPIGVAVDENGVVYVTDHGNCRVQTFSLDGQFLDSWPSRCGNGPGELTNPGLIAVRAGRAYISAHACGVIEVFQVDGTFISELPCEPGHYYGVALGQDGSLWATMIDPDLVRHFTAEGELLGEWPAVPPGSLYPEPLGIDLDSAGNVYVANGVEYRIDKYSSGGEYLESIDVEVPRELDVVGDRELYVVTLFGQRVHKFVRVPVTVEDVTWGGVKSLFR